MDINVDQAKPRGDLERLESGKYIYKLENDKFDIDKFNRDFDQYKDQRKKEMEETLQGKLDELNKPKEQIPAYNLSMGQIVINIKDTLFNILDDMLHFNFTWDIILKENRLFYLGLTFIFIACVVYFYMFFILFEDVPPKQTNVYELRLFNGPN